MKNIKILTFINENNYGALLQSFALQEACKALGFNVSFINYRFQRPKGNATTRLLFWIKNPSHILRKLNLLPPEKKIDFSSFIDFRKKYLSIDGNLFSNFRDISSNPPVSDIYITGSDQVWSERIVSKQDLKSFFLCFGDRNVIRVSYAASFGGESLSDETINSMRSVWRGIDFCSIRENDTTTSIKRLGIEDYKLVPDPTLLIDWYKRNEFSISSNKTVDIGIFILNPKHRNKFQSAIGEGSIKSKPFEINLNSDGVSVNPFVWVENISKCKFFVTDSYHAVIFSILTKTNFAVLLHEGEGSARNLRIVELLRRFGLEDRCSIRFNQSDLALMKSTEIDWFDVEVRLVEFRKIGLDFLKSL